MAGVGTVTLLFTDLVGSTALASRVGDVELDGILRAHFATLRAAVASTGGDEVKNLGDGLLVAYRSASDAVEGAVAMQRAVDRANTDAKVALSMKVGMSVGDVTEVDGDWFGMPVNEASRLCATADGGQILASDVVRLLAGSRARHTIRPAGSRELKGLPEPVNVCEVEWARVRESVAVPLPAGLTADREIVGRDAELAQLLEIWRDAMAGTAATVARRRRARHRQDAARERDCGRGACRRRDGADRSMRRGPGRAVPAVDRSAPVRRRCSRP